MNLSYQSTCGGEARVTASQAILKGSADDSGPLMLTEIPKLSLSMEEVSKMSYQETACKVMKLFFIGFIEEEPKSCIIRAYDEKFDTEVTALFVKADGAYCLELFHGSMIMFKDMTFSTLPHLMTTSARKNHVDKEIMILTATSGDTGRATMARLVDVEGTRIIVFYPKDGVSWVQEFQMVTQKGDNISAMAIHGNLDDAQTGVKKIFADRDFGEMPAGQRFQLSSANSINIGRPVPQVAYHVYAHGKPPEGGEIMDGEMTNMAVPTGNLGNTLAAYFAKQIGVSIGKLICAPNDSRMLYDFFTTGAYDRNRDFILTNSPSMDILTSSNLERLIHLSTGCDAKKTVGPIADLAQKGSYEAMVDMKERMVDFAGGFATQEEDVAAIRNLHEETGYVLDTHTGVACAVYKSCQAATDDKIKTVIASTASPYKFSRSVLEAITGQKDSRDEFEVVDELCRVSGVAVLKVVEEIRGVQVCHSLECEVDDMKDTIGRILDIWPR